MEWMGLSPPRARSEGLLTRELPDGMMVFDERRQQAHSLNQTATLVWHHCDGRTSVPEMATRLHQELGVPADEELVWLALDRLDKAHLLQERLSRPGEAARTTRRAVIRKLGLAGGLVALLPLVDSLNAPPALAATSASGGGACPNGADCSVCGTTGNGPKLCCSGPSNTVVCANNNSANCANCPA